jgi:hypothetical protein
MNWRKRNMAELCDARTNFNNDRGVTLAIVSCSLEAHDEEEMHVSKVKGSDPPAIVKWFGRAPAPRKDK